MSVVADGNSPGQGHATSPRRPISARTSVWARAAAAWLKQLGVRPNQVSIASIGFALLAGWCLVTSTTAGVGWRRGMLLAAAGLILLRLLCNLFDGMLAVEGGLKSKAGEVFNDLPDRIADSVILVCAGYATTSVAWGTELGWLAAVVALLTAYVRLLGVAAGLAPDFGGPMAKPTRMYVLILGCLGAAVETAFGWDESSMALALSLIVVGCVATIVQRTRRMIRALEAR